MKIPDGSGGADGPPLVPWVAFGTALALLAVVLALPTTALVPDPFAGADTARLARIQTLPLGDLASAHLRHARDTHPAIGLFGNSRAVMVGAGDLGVRGDRFHNFSLPGGSLRQSVALLEALAADNALPAVALISLDHLALNYYGAAEWPGPPRRWREAASDFLHAAGQSRGSLFVLKIGLDHLLTEWRQTTTALGADRLHARLAYLLPAAVPPLLAPPPPLAVDGSRPEGGGGGADSPGTEMFFAMPTYLERDLARLAALADAGSDLLIYESPLQPENVSIAAAAARAEVASNRALVTDLCRRHGLRCVLDPPALGDPADWPDCCHPPAAALAAYLRAIAPKQIFRP